MKIVKVLVHYKLPKEKLDEIKNTLNSIGYDPIFTTTKKFGDITRKTYCWHCCGSEMVWWRNGDWDGFQSKSGKLNAVYYHCRVCESGVKFMHIYERNE